VATGHDDGMDIFNTILTRFGLLLERHPLVFTHMVCALAALALGAFVLMGRKGNTAHRTAGWAWVALMAGVTITGAFIRDYHLPNIAGITPIHAFVVLVGWQLPRAVMYARRGQIDAHRQAMRGLYKGGCLLAGAFTLLPGRFLGNTLWKHTLGWIS
jgi:uncharacterized membrane protein